MHTIRNTFSTHLLISDDAALKFQKLTLDCIESLRPYFIQDGSRICDSTVGSTFMWRDFHKTEYALSNGVLYLKASLPEPVFARPRGLEAGFDAYERIFECSANPVRICSVPESDVESFMQKFPGSKAWTDRAWSDYLYLSDDIKGLAGRKYSGQRNHINRFKKENPVWSFEPIGADNLPRATEFVNQLTSFNYQLSTYVDLLQNFTQYGTLLGGILYADDTVIGVSTGEIVGDTLFIHSEKADTTYHGAYPMLVNQFAKMFADETVVYINREEDDGVEGLRTSKLSYHPVGLLSKYVVEICR